MAIKRNHLIFYLLILGMLPVYGLQAVSLSYNTGKEKKTVFLSDEESLIIGDREGDGKIEGRLETVKKSNINQAQRMFKSSKVLPLFYDTPDGGGRIRTLPGGIIVKFKKGIIATQINSWAKQKKLEIKHIFKTPGKVMINSPEGLATLDLINEIITSDSIIEEARPNWLTKVEAK